MLLLALALLSAMIVRAMISIGALDHPVARSSHTTPTPKGGGVGIAATVAAGMAIAGRADTQGLAITGAALALAAASYLDDVRSWPFWIKLAAQLGAALAVIAAGLSPWQIAVPGGVTMHPGLLAPVLAMGWLVYTTNATNFMDGLNGLAAGSTAAACLVLALVLGPRAAWPECLIVAGVAGFLPFNYPAARIFMGDVGSQFLGLMLAALALRHAADARVMAVLPLGLSPMLLDVGLTLLRRWRRGDRLTDAHRSHFYQVAQRAGMKVWLVSLLYAAMAGWAAWCGVQWGITAHIAWPVAAVLPFVGWLIYVAWRARSAGLARW